MKELQPGGFPQDLMDHVYMIAAEDSTSVDFSYNEKQGEEGKDDGLTENEYNKLQEQQLQQCNTRKPIVRMQPRTSTRPSKKDKRKLLRAVERTDKVLSDEVIDRVISILGS